MKFTSRTNFLTNSREKFPIWGGDGAGAGDAGGRIVDIGSLDHSDGGVWCVSPESADSGEGFSGDAESGAGGAQSSRPGEARAYLERRFRWHHRLLRRWYFRSLPNRVILSKSTKNFSLFFFLYSVGFLTSS